MGVAVGLAAVVGVSQDVPAAVSISEGTAAPFTGVLVPEVTYRAMGQAVLDLVAERKVSAAYKRGHALALEAMIRAQEALTMCEPKRSQISKVLSTIRDLAFVAIPLACAIDE